MTVKQSTIDQFRPQRANRNKHKERGMGALEVSMRKLGYVAPMTAAASGEIIDGSARLETSAIVFDDDVLVVHHDGTKPVIMVRDDIPNADTPEARQIAIAANRIASINLEWDAEGLLADAQSGLDLSGLFSQGELDEMLAELTPPMAGADTEPQVDKAAELQAKWGTSTGQLWQLGQHRLIVGDCTDRAVVERLMGGEKAVLSPTDPPYNVGFDYDGSTVDDRKSHEKYEQFSRAWFALCQFASDRQIVTPGGVNHILWARWFDSDHCGAWIKTNASTFGRVSNSWCWEPVFFFGKKWQRSRANDVFDYPVGQQRNVANHPCPKPLTMWEDLLENYTTSGDLIYEPFGGSGTSFIAAHNLNRRCYGCEISPAYCGVILQRFLDHTGIEPQLIES